jgi:hypothetical protein
MLKQQLICYDSTGFFWIGLVDLLLHVAQKFDM